MNVALEPLRFSSSWRQYQQREIFVAVKFEVPTTVKMSMTIMMCEVTPCGLVSKYQCGGTSLAEGKNAWSSTPIRKHLHGVLFN